MPECVPACTQCSFNPYSSGTISTTSCCIPHRSFSSLFQSLFFWNNLNNADVGDEIERQDPVSILILLEQSQQPILNATVGSSPFCFNPYSSGTISTTVDIPYNVRYSIKFQSLFFWNNLNNSDTEQRLLTEVMFQSLFFWNNLNNTICRGAKPWMPMCFNPYSSGTISTTAIDLLPCPLHCRFNPYSSGTISTTCRASRCLVQDPKVSILILLEQSQQPNPARCRTAAARCFNPYSSGTISTTAFGFATFGGQFVFQSLFFWNNLNNLVLML